MAHISLALFYEDKELEAKNVPSVTISDLSFTSVPNCFHADSIELNL